MDLFYFLFSPLCIRREWAPWAQVLLLPDCRVAGVGYPRKCACSQEGGKNNRDISASRSSARLFLGPCEVLSKVTGSGQYLPMPSQQSWLVPAEGLKGADPALLCGTGTQTPKEVWEVSNLIQVVMKVEKELRKKAQEGGSQKHSAFKNGMSKVLWKKTRGWCWGPNPADGSTRFCPSLRPGLAP